MRYAGSVACPRTMHHRRASHIREDNMQLHRHLAWVAAAAFGLASVGSGLASENKIAVAPGGPHPYFAPWEQAAADAKKDFGIAAVDYKVPSDWKLELQQ